MIRIFERVSRNIADNKYECSGHNQSMNCKRGVFYRCTKTIFTKPWNIWKAQKGQVNIIFPSTFWLEKRPYFLSPKSSKQELLCIHQISSFINFSAQKRPHFPSRKSSKKDFSSISKYHISIIFLAQKRPYIPYPKILNQELFSNQ